MRAICPGQDSRKIQVAYHHCPHCGAENEFFFNDVRVNCHQCGELIYKERLPSCVDWCPAARACVGEERWKQLHGERPSKK